jgi:hypothetical protein
MTLRSQVYRFLKQEAPAAYCDDCLAKRVDVLKTHIDVLARELYRTAAVWRMKKTCTACGREKTVTSYRLSAAAEDVGGGAHTMKEPRYHIQEDGHGRYEVIEAGAVAPLTIMDTLEEAVALVKRIERVDAPD